jgi:hypothetical protein
VSVKFAGHALAIAVLYSGRIGIITLSFAAWVYTESAKITASNAMDFTLLVEHFQVPKV